MKPQQQNTYVKGHSNVFVQKPDGEQINVKTKQTNSQKQSPQETSQTAENVPTKSSSEVKDGEDG